MVLHWGRVGCRQHHARVFVRFAVVFSTLDRCSLEDAVFASRPTGLHGLTTTRLWPSHVCVRLHSFMVFTMKAALRGGFCVLVIGQTLYTVPMSWASRKRLMIIGSAVAVLIVVGAGTAFAVLYHAPSCADRKQDQSEDGIDCGGPCQTLCTASVVPPVVRFVRPLTPVSGRTDVIAYLENKNASAVVHGAQYTIELYGVDNSLVAKKQGTVDLPPSALIPIFVPGFFSGYQPVSRAFLSFDESSLVWMRATGAAPTVPIAGNIQLAAGSPPRITATLTNPSATPLYNEKVVVTIFDAAGNVIGASQTVIPTIPAQGTAPAVFTWNEPFPGTPVKIEVVPVLTLAPTP